VSKVWHVVVFQTAPDVTPERVDDMRARFKACVGPCDGLEWVRAGSNTSRSEFAEGWPEGIVMQFRDAAARDAYLVHPLHQAISQEARGSYYTDLVICDMEVEPVG
jgi:hypothetical protein